MQQGADALEYFHQSFSQIENKALYNATFPCTKTPVAPILPSVPSGRTLLVVTIITTRRQAEYHYLLQVAHSFLKQISECGPNCYDVRLLICNVDLYPASHEDACLLSQLLSSVERHVEGQEDDSPNIFEREKQDYAFCLSSTLEVFNPEYVLLIEDDAVAEAEIFSAFFELVHVRFSQEPLGGGLYTKLYHPERLQGYLNPEPMRILEWFGLGSLTGLALNFGYTLLFYQLRFSWRQFIALALYSMLMAELFGRHYILELRRILPALYNVVPATECCTPAMLFSESSARRTLVYLDELTCKAGYAKDTALYRELGRRGERAWALEPNMVKHVGLFSTLRGSFDNTEPQLL
ncbi:transmembrane protein 246 [Xenopus tropicalis]|eukprot:NP_001072549.1 transmembrane protein 246 [Xenopus tropicalis]